MIDIGVPLSKAVKKVGISRTTAYKYLNAQTLQEGSAL